MPAPLASTSFHPSMVTTAFELPRLPHHPKLWRCARNCRALALHLRTIGAGLQTIVGGNITIYTDLCEKTRNDAFIMMMQHAGERGANAVIAARYDSNEVMNGVTEVLAYGTAVFVEPV